MNLVTLKNTKLQKSITFLYTNNKQLKIEVKKIQFIIISKNWNYKSDKICANHIRWILQNTNNRNQIRSRWIDTL